MKENKLSILCVSDHVDPLVYSQSAKERFKHIDLVLAAGDLNMDYQGFIASTLNKPLLFVFGNHNLSKFHLFNKKAGKRQPMNVSHKSQTQNYYGSTYISDKCVKEKGLLIAGLGGSIRYNNGENQYTNGQMFRRILKLIPRLLVNKLRYGRYLDILLTHASPYGIHDTADPCHIGFRPFLWFMKKFKPKYLVHGHIHLYDLNAHRRTKYYDTEVVNCYDHIVIDINTTKSKEEQNE